MFATSKNTSLASARFVAKYLLFLSSEQIVTIIAFAGIMYATNLFNTVAKVDLDEVLYDFRLDGKKGE